MPQFGYILITDSMEIRLTAAEAPPNAGLDLPSAPTPTRLAGRTGTDPGARLLEGGIMSRGRVVGTGSFSRAL